MDIQDLRGQIDDIDRQLVSLFGRRMAVAAQIAAYKADHSMAVHVPAREREVLERVSQIAGPELARDSRTLYSLIFELSRSYQTRLSGAVSPLYAQISQAISTTSPLFPPSPMVACQGVEGAYSQIACEKLFREPNILYVKNFDSVFQAIDQGLCHYGVLPLENSTDSSVKKIYDLLIRHRFSIVRAYRLKLDHNLLANAGASLGTIREIYSHQQAINQCTEFLRAFPRVKLIPVENTATAAQLVATSGRTDVAALSSRGCARLYGLTCLASSVQDKGSDRTRFICVSKNLEIYPGSDRTSLMLVLPNRPGALYRVLARLYALGINVIKLESRPMAERESDYMFYFDLETSIYSPEFPRLMGELEDLCEEFRYLGSYLEVV